MNPYAILNVPKDASKTTIQKAFRKLSKSLHPDCGGDAEEFKAVHAAYKLLMDDARRAHFDKTGEVIDDKPNKGLGEIMQIVAHVFMNILNEIVEKGVDSKAVDWIESMRDVVRRHRQELASTQATVKKLLANIDDLKARFTVEDGENLIQAMVANQAVSLAQQLQKLEADIALDERVLEFLKKYRFKVERTIQMWARTSASTWTTTM